VSIKAITRRLSGDPRAFAEREVRHEGLGRRANCRLVEAPFRAFELRA
jgi:hypothetical protein